MADNVTTQQSVTGSGEQEPLLRKGRSADPAPGQPRAEAPPPEELSESAPEEALEDAAPGIRPAETNKDEPELVMAQSRQRRLRLLLRQCDRVLLMDFELLAMSHWPDNFTLASARKNRDLWVFCALIAALVFFSGLTGFVPAWIAGGGFGAFVIIVLLGLPGIRRIYSSRPSYLDLILARQRMMRDARKHVEHLEGKEGLAWQCARLADYNPALRSPRFSRILTLSEHRVLARNLVRREHIRLYLIFLLEAEKAYNRVQNAYLEGHHQALDQGWQPAEKQTEEDDESEDPQQEA